MLPGNLTAARSLFIPRECNAQNLLQHRQTFVGKQSTAGNHSSASLYYYYTAGICLAGVRPCISFSVCVCVTGARHVMQPLSSL